MSAGLQHFLQASRKNCYLAYCSFERLPTFLGPWSLPPPGSKPAVYLSDHLSTVTSLSLSDHTLLKQNALWHCGLWSANSFWLWVAVGKKIIYHHSSSEIFIFMSNSLRIFFPTRVLGCYIKTHVHTKSILYFSKNTFQKLFFH